MNTDPLYALGLYQQLQSRSTNKWQAFTEVAGDDGRVRGAHQYRGASRTGRDAHRLAQPGNMPCGNLKDPILAADMMLAGGHPWVAHHTSTNVMDYLRSTLRPAIAAPDGDLLAIADLASIESRVIAWYADCKEMLDIFAAGKCTYRTFATWFYGCEYHEVTTAQRSLCKPPVLGAGYALSAGLPERMQHDRYGNEVKKPATGLIAYADAMGTKLTREQSEQMIKLFRSSFSAIPEMWKWLDDAFKYVIDSDVGTQVSGHRVTFTKEKGAVTLTLPSGRRLFYLKAAIASVVPPWGRDREIPAEWATINGKEMVIRWAPNPRYGETKDTITYYGHNQQTKGKWVRIPTHAGKTTEQMTQAIARDIFFYGLALYELGYGESKIDSPPSQEDLGKELTDRINRGGLSSRHGIVLRVHDEGVSNVPADKAHRELERLITCMSTVPPYGDEKLYLGAEGFVSKRYRKG